MSSSISRPVKQARACPGHKLQPKTTPHRIVKKKLALYALAFAPLVLIGCLSVRTHSTFDPIYLNLDINLKVQLQEELADIFGEIDAASSTVSE